MKSIGFIISVVLCGALVANNAKATDFSGVSTNSIEQQKTTQQTIKLPGLISDNMVLQQNRKVRLWGTGVPSSEIVVYVSWSPDRVTGRTDTNGRWELQIPTPAASFDAQTVTIECGAEKKVLSNVLIGEVWFGSGQSNMEMPIRGFDNCPIEGANETVALSGKYPNIRYATISRVGKTTPQEYAEGGEWKENIPQNNPEFGATGYYFATKLADVLNVPIGIINCSWGGSTVEGWLPQNILSGYEDVNLADAGSKTLHPMLQPMIMYNGMLKPSSKYTVKGFLWYQGESNVGRKDYAKRLATMVEHWRLLWRQGELPFYEVEIAPYEYEAENKAAYLREQQFLAQQLIPNSGMISTNDLVEPYETRQIHPKDKQNIGNRLAYMALANTYGYKSIGSRGPEYKSVTIDGNKALVSFGNADNGFNRFDGIEGFEIAGADKKFYPAKAKVNWSKRAIEVTSEEVATPVAVRYCFKNFQIGNLKNLSGLPAVPFRTDQW